MRATTSISSTASNTSRRLLVLLLCLLAFGLVLLLNTLTILMSFVGALLAATYPFMKRVTYLPQIYLGAAFGWAVPMAFTAVQGSIPPLAWVLFAFIFVATLIQLWYMRRNLGRTYGS